MKVTFKTDYLGKSYATSEFNNAIELNELKVAKRISNNVNRSVFDCLKDKCSFLAIPMNKIANTEFVVKRVLVVKSEERGYNFLCDDGCVLYAENNDILFTTEKEARNYAERENRIDFLVKYQNELLEKLAQTDIELHELSEDCE